MRTYLKDLRKKAGLNQTQVAKALGITQVAISQLESGRNKAISTQVAEKLARLYRCDIHTIIEGEQKHASMTNGYILQKNIEKI